MTAIRYVLTGAERRIPTYPGLSLPPSARRLLAKCADADCAVLAYTRDRLVGFARYWSEDGIAAGTWVAPAYRRRGVASHMWRLLVKRHGTPVEVATTSRAGRAFARKLLSGSELQGIVGPPHFSLDSRPSGA